MVCEQKKYRDNINSASLAGLMIGALLFGNLADRYGRKALMISCCIGASIVCFLQEPLSQGFEKDRLIVHDFSESLLSQISLYGFIAARVVMLALIYGAAIAQFVYAVESASVDGSRLDGLYDGVNFATADVDGGQGLSSHRKLRRGPEKTILRFR